MLDFPSNPTHNQKLTSGIIEFWFDQNLPAWSRALATSAVPPPLTAASLAPTEYSVGDPDFVLTVTGAGFTEDCVIQIGGVAMPTTFVSATQLTTQIATAAITTAGLWEVTVNSPSSAQTTSPLNFVWT